MEMPRIVDGRSRVLESQGVVDLLVAPKWRITVLDLLRDGSLRTSDLQSAMEEVSAKVLTETLRGMERDGLIGRKGPPGRGASAWSTA
jgi:DNA-binding HxlR family transcriptional regulator